MDGRGTLFALVAARRQKVFKRGIDTYAKHVCRRRRDGSQNFPLFVLFVLFGQAKRTLKEKNHKVTFRLSYFCVTKSTKSQQGGLAPSSFRTTGGVHELVAISSAWQVRAANSRTKSDSLALSAISTIPRVRTYHTKKPSRFVHALSARPLDNGWRA